MQIKLSITPCYSIQTPSQSAKRDHRLCSSPTDGKQQITAFNYYQLRTQPVTYRLSSYNVGEHHKSQSSISTTTDHSLCSSPKLDSTTNHSLQPLPQHHKSQSSASTTTPQITVFSLYHNTTNHSLQPLPQHHKSQSSASTTIPQITVFSLYHNTTNHSLQPLPQHHKSQSSASTTTDHNLCSLAMLESTTTHSLRCLSTTADDSLCPPPMQENTTGQLHV